MAYADPQRRIAYYREWRKKHPDYDKQRYANSAEQREKRKARTRAWNALNKERVRISNRCRKYGMTPEEIESLRKSQNNQCAICEVQFDDADRTTAMCVDHSHVTRKIRGLLCNTCNRALGLLKDNPAVLEKGIAYLRKHLDP